MFQNASIQKSNMKTNGVITRAEEEKNRKTNHPAFTKKANLHQRINDNIKIIQYGKMMFTVDLKSLKP